MADVTHFEPPEGLHPHEACFLLPSKETDDWFECAVATAYLEMADSGTLTLGPDKYLVRHDVPGVTLTPFQDKVATLMTGRTRFMENLMHWRKLVWARLAEQGWVEAESGRLTAEGQVARQQLAGYREYLAKAMTDRVHHAVIEGRVDRDEKFAAGLRIMSSPNVYRAVAVRLGGPVEGLMASAFDLMGGKASEQHAVSIRGNRPPAWCLAILAFWVIGFLALFAYAWSRQNA